MTTGKNEMSKIISEIDEHEELIVAYHALVSIHGVARAFYLSSDRKPPDGSQQKVAAIFRHLMDQINGARVAVTARAAELPAKDHWASDQRHQIMVADATLEHDLPELRDFIDGLIDEIDDENERFEAEAHQPGEVA